MEHNCGALGAIQSNLEKYVLGSCLTIVGFSRNKNWLKIVKSLKILLLDTCYGYRKQYLIVFTPPSFLQNITKVLLTIIISVKLQLCLEIPNIIIVSPAWFVIEPQLFHPTLIHILPQQFPIFPWPFLEGIISLLYNSTKTLMISCYDLIAMQRPNWNNWNDVSTFPLSL